MDDPRITAAIFGAVFGIVGSLLTALISNLAPGIAYFIKRKIEKTKPKEDLELIAKAVEINKQFKEQGLPAEFKVKEILEASIGQKVHQYISFQEDKNTTEILTKAKPLISQTDELKNIESTWFIEYFSNARKVSDSEVQNIWAKILADEIKKPGQFSLHTVNILSYITKEDIEILEIIAGMYIQDKFLFLLKTEADFHSVGLAFPNLLRLQELNLLTLDKLSYTMEYDNQFVLKISNQLKVFVSKTPNPNPGEIRKIKFPTLAISEAAAELLRLVTHRPNPSYLHALQEKYADFEIRDF